MNPVILEVSTSLLVIDDPSYPDRDDSLIYDHLRYYCSMYRPLDASWAKYSDGRLMIVGGHKYVLLAREFGLPTHRIVIVEGAESKELPEWITAVSAKRISLDEIRRHEFETAVLDGHHVFFFRDALNERQKTLFIERIPTFFLRLDSPLLAGRTRVVLPTVFAHGGTSAMFQATTPAGDESWFGDFRHESINFSETVARIDSYQGRRFAY